MLDRDSNNIWKRIFSSLWNTYLEIKILTEPQPKKGKLLCRIRKAKLGFT